MRRMPPERLLDRDFDDWPEVLLDRDFDDWQAPQVTGVLDPEGLSAIPGRQEYARFNPSNYPTTCSGPARVVQAVKSEFTHSGEARAHAQTKKPRPPDRHHHPVP